MLKHRLISSDMLLLFPKCFMCCESDILKMIVNRYDFEWIFGRFLGDWEIWRCDFWVNLRHWNDWNEIEMIMKKWKLTVIFRCVVVRCFVVPMSVVLRGCWCGVDAVCCCCCWNRIVGFDGKECVAWIQRNDLSVSIASGNFRYVVFSKETYCFGSG